MDYGAEPTRMYVVDTPHADIVYKVLHPESYLNMQHNRMAASLEVDEKQNWGVAGNRIN